MENKERWVKGEEKRTGDNEQRARKIRALESEGQDSEYSFTTYRLSHLRKSLNLSELYFPIYKMGIIF